MSIATQLEQLADSKNDIKEVLIEKGVDTENFNFNNLSTLMENMSGGGSTIDTDLEIPASCCRYLFTLTQVDTDVVINLYIKPDVVYKSYKFKPSSIGITSSDEIDWSYFGQKIIKIYDNVIVLVVPSSDAAIIIVSTNGGETWSLIRKDSSGNKLHKHLSDYGIGLRMNAYSFGVIIDDMSSYPSQKYYYYSDDFSSIRNVSESEYDDYFSNDITPIEKNSAIDDFKGTHDATIIEQFKNATNLTSNQHCIMTKCSEFCIILTAASSNQYGPTLSDAYISKDLINWIKIDKTKTTGIYYAFTIKNGYVIYVSHEDAENYFIYIDKNDFSNQRVIYETGRDEYWSHYSIAGEYIVSSTFSGGTQKGILIDNNGFVIPVTNSGHDEFPSNTMWVYTGKKSISKNDAINALI